jgi:hypothetical protein
MFTATTPAARLAAPRGDRALPASRGPLLRTTATLVLGLAAATGCDTDRALAPSTAPTAAPSLAVTASTQGTYLGAELPRVRVDTRLRTARTGRRLVVPAGASLQRALDTARLGDVILLAPGATYTGNFRLRAKPAAPDTAAPITIRPNVADAVLPAPGTRMTPARAATARLPKIVSPNGMAAIRTDVGAHHYRLLGVEVTAASSVASSTNLVGFGQTGTGQDTRAEAPHHLIVDRSYVHGRDNLVLKRCIEINSAWTAVIDSYVAGCHSNWQDSQAIAGWNGPGPFAILNNYLEGAGETFMLGGADPTIPNLVPSDVEVRGNHFRKPASWVQVWLVKNSFELKAARRVLVEGNVFDGVWRDAQDGYHFNLKSANQGGRCGWCVTEHVTVRRNLLRNSGAGIGVNGGEAPAGGSVGRTNHVVITGNRLEPMNVAGTPYVGAGRPFQVGAVDYLTIDHNTIDNRGLTNLVFFAKAVGPQFRFTGNIGYRNRYGFVSLSTYAPRALISGNVFIAESGTTYSTYGTGNVLAPTMADALGRTTTAAGASSTTAGAPEAALRAATAGAVSGIAVPMPR